MRTSEQSANGRRATFVALALLVALAALMFHPLGFKGSGSDDQRYLDAALAWWNGGPQLGHTHWAIRHPLILSTLGTFALFGPGIAATIWVPRLFALLLVAVSVIGMDRLAGRRAAWIWLALFLASPILHQSATSLYPEMPELALVVAALWIGAPRAAGLGRIAAAGALLGVAMTVRETSLVGLAALALKLVLDRRGVSALAALAFGAALPFLADAAWLWSRSGDWLYRFHIDRGHVGIASTDLQGRVFRGSPFFNLDLASRWKPVGPARIHWAVNPLVDLGISTKFALLFVAWLAGDLLRRNRGASPAYDRLRPWLLGVSLAAYLLVCWVLMLSPQPRYFLLPLYAATVAVALLLDQRWSRGGRPRKQAIAALVVLVAVGAVTIALRSDEEAAPRSVLAYLELHPGNYRTDPLHAAMMKAWIEDRPVPSTVIAGEPSPVARWLNFPGDPLPVTQGLRLLPIDRFPVRSIDWLHAKPFGKKKMVTVYRVEPVAG